MNDCAYVTAGWGIHDERWLGALRQLGKDPMVVQKAEYSKSGRNASVVKMKMRNLLTKAVFDKAFKAGEWNRVRIECRGESIKTWLNDVPAADLKDSRVMSGFIGLQVHGVKQDKLMEVRFRDIRLKELLD